ncbi:RNA 2'-phosphotransferase [Flavobacterium amniphilum]|uniref:RNA 2'-phosphotransferase n=1 Tax=Flavobacterium amniphilum TaxID=1834035 RepID=UPI00202A0C5C|nr:RNA 2'-phosphotransferase [Flavobacterium amniphilum]MCL9805943.1 RNA 2'-phosphotransferase [Flavobacterium amniphilum]
MNNDTKNISKFLSLVLRHAPETIKLSLDVNGWADVEELLKQCNAFQKKLDKETLEQVVETNDKKRFAFNDDKTKIRASQGHSVAVDLDIKPITPPDILFHGTVEKFLEAIKKEGLQKMSRQHVHLSKDIETATKVASRRGKPVILSIETQRMVEDGYLFYCSENGVWLTDEVPVAYIKF